MSYSKLSPARRIAAALLPITALSLGRLRQPALRLPGRIPRHRDERRRPVLRTHSYSVGICLRHCRCHRYGVSHRLGGPLRLG